MYKIFKIALLFVVIFCNQSFSQLLPNKHSLNLNAALPAPNASGITPQLPNSINYYTGTNSIGFELFSYNDAARGLNHSISLSYNGGGIKVDDIASNVGLGWNLNTGGVINRMIQGLPDEIPLRGFSARPLNDTVLFYDFYTKQGDGEIDQFAYVAGNSSGQFMFGKNGQVLSIPRSNNKIERTMGSMANIQTTCPAITFKITDENGMQYFYSSSDCSRFNAIDTTDKFFVSSAWYLTLIVSAFNTDTIYFDYVSKPTGGYYIGSSSVEYKTGSYSHTFNTSISSTVSNEKRLSTIRYPDGTVVTINHDSFKRLDLKSENAISSVVISNGTSSYGYKFGYTYFGSITTGLSGTTNDITYQNYDALSLPQGLYRLKLKTFKKYSGAVTLKGHSFSYNSALIEDRGSSSNVDAWGYQSSLAGNRVTGSRKAELAGSKAGSLESVTYPTGGSISWEYELHKTTNTSHPYRVYESSALHSTIEDIGHTVITNYRKSQSNPITVPTISGVPTVYSYLKLIPMPADGGPPYFPACWSSYTFDVRILKSTGGSYFPVAAATVSYTLAELNANTIKYIDVGPAAAGDLFKFEFDANTTCSSPVQPYGYMSREWSFYTRPPVGDVGGLRVKKVTTYDGVNHAKDIIEEFSYLTTSGDHSGVMVNYPIRTYDYDECYDSGASDGDMDDTEGHPVFYVGNQVVTTPSHQTNYTYTVNTDNSLNMMYSAGGGIIGYGMVTEYMGTVSNNKGKTVHTFSTFNDYTFLTSVKANIFPFIPQPIASFKYGLPLKQLVYDQSGVLKKKIENTFQINSKGYNQAEYKSMKLMLEKKGCGAILDDGVRADDIYKKGTFYPISGRVYLTYAREVEYFTTGDSLVNDTWMTHDTINHVQTKVEITNGEGDLFTRKIYYAFQYNIAGPMTSLQNANAKFFPVSVESWKKIGVATPILLNASANTFKAISSGSIKPDNTYALAINSPVAESNWGSFDNTKILQQSSLYNLSGNIVSYDSEGNALEASKDGVSSSMVWGYKKSRLIAKSSNASTDEIGFTSFESEDQDLWKPYNTGVTLVTTDKHTGNSSVRVNENKIGPTRKYAPAASASQSKKYIFSCWIKTAPSFSGTGKLVIHTTDNTLGSTAVYPSIAEANKSFTFSSTNDKWQYFSVIIDLAAIHTISGVATPFRIRTYVENLDNAKHFWVDDIRFHPLDANMITYTYNPLYGVTSNSNENNTPVFYEHDLFGRLKFTKDLDGKILERKEYNDQE